MTDDTADIVEAIAKLRDMGALKVTYRGCEVLFDQRPLRQQESAISAEAEYARIALASVT